MQHQPSTAGYLHQKHRSVCLRKSTLASTLKKPTAATKSSNSSKTSVSSLNKTSLKPHHYLGLDLVCCRNVLIYFDSNLQEQVLSILHGALNPCGFLVLGESESVGKLSAVFETLESKGVVYVKKSTEKGGLMV